MKTGLLNSETYAQFRIRGAILDELRSRDDAPRSVRSKETMLKDALEMLRKKFGRHPTDEEISDYFGISLKNYYKLLDEARGVRILSNDDLPSDYCEKYGTYEVLEKIDQNSPFFLLARSELKEALKNAIDYIEGNRTDLEIDGIKSLPDPLPGNTETKGRLEKIQT
jgi:RNA polymerase sigma factor for flagellar operon FliA